MKKLHTSLLVWRTVSAALGRLAPPVMEEILCFILCKSFAYFSTIYSPLPESSPPNILDCMPIGAAIVLSFFVK